MATPKPFTGFPVESFTFFQNLITNNNRDWFQAHKQDYLDYIVSPAQSFVATLGQKLQTLSPDIIYDTRTNGSGSMMRIYRDIRFSPDKTPYKTYLGLVFWQGAGKKTECPAFYFGLDGEAAGLHVGMYQFPKPFLKAYRAAVADDITGTEFETALATVKSNGHYEFGGEQYARVPRGYPKDHPREALLRYKGFNASAPNLNPAVVASPDLVKVCFDHCRNMFPLHRWLVKVM